MTKSRCFHLEAITGNSIDKVPICIECNKVLTQKEIKIFWAAQKLKAIRNTKIAS